MSEPLVPPNPNELDRVYSSAILSRRVRHVVKIAALAGLMQIDGRRRHLIAQRQHGKNCLDRPGGTQQVPGHRLGRTHGQFIGGRAEGAPNRECFGAVAEFGRGGMRIDVLHLFGIQRASVSALAIALRAPSPSSGGAVTWNASPLMPKPTISA